MILGLDDLSFISILDLELAFVQSKSSLVYISWGMISNKSASFILASFSATALVIPDALKYATNCFIFDSSYNILYVSSSTGSHHSFVA